MPGVDIKAILANPVLRKKMIVGAIIFIQAVEGIETTQEQAEAAYEKAQRRNAALSRNQ